MKSLHKWRLLGVMVLIASSAGAGEKAAGFRLKVDEILAKLESAIPSVKLPAEKLDLVQKSLVEISKSRSQYPNLVTGDEMYLSMLTGALQEIPKSAEFKLSDCSKYRHNILKNYEPTAEKAPQDPAIKKAFEVLNLVCKDEHSVR